MEKTIPLPNALSGISLKEAHVTWVDKENFYPPTYTHFDRTANACEEAADFSAGVLCPVIFHG